MLYGCDPHRGIRAKSPKSNASSGDDSDAEELPPTYELIELAPPGIDAVLTIQECRPRDNPNQKQRNLRKEFSAGKKEGKGEEEEEDEVDCSLFRGLTAASKIFDNAK